MMAAALYELHTFFITKNMRRFTYSHSVYICFSDKVFSQTDVSGNPIGHIPQIQGRQLTTNIMAFAFKEEIAPNIHDLKKMAATKSDANLRLQAIEELGKWKSQQSIDILWRLMMNDLVYEVQNAAFLRLQSFGEQVKLPRKAKGNLIKQIDKKIEKVLKSIEGQITFSEFVETFQKKLPEEFDAYKHEKKNNFEKWLNNIVIGFPADIKAKIKVD